MRILMKPYNAYYKSPIGIMKITASNLGILSTGFINNNIDLQLDEVSKYNDFSNNLKQIKLIENSNKLVSIEVEKDMNLNAYKYLKDCVIQLDEYFEGKRKNFKLKIHTTGTDFRRRIWNELMKIPYGSTCSYMDIAESIGNKNAVRAVGGANHNNNIIIIIPCHRVIGKNGSLTGYGAGLWRKKWLIEHEKKFKDNKSYDKLF